ncbi:ribonuclease III [Paraglaciecola sp.]|uniref:ribonuclease III n=1 Tax=Paraglaciecola sp. TaxID=1920173 RepID=UPI0030F38864
MQLVDPYIHLYKKIAYTFAEPENLTRALTHRSANKKHNERLEFLGDAILGMIIAKELYERFPQQPEGKLTRMRSNLVKGDTLAAVAREFALGDLLLLGPGELKSGGFRRDSILADALEAIIGAIYLEAGLTVCEPIVLRWFEQRLNELDPQSVSKDDKTRLQEFLQAKKHPLPLYEVTEITGQSHEQIFYVECTVAGLDKVTVGKGNSRRKAEQKAARLAFEKLSNGK